MTRKVNSYSFGKQIKLVALAALFLAPVWAWGQTSTQNVRKQGRGILGLFLVLMLMAYAMPAKLQAQTHPYSGVWYMQSFKNTSYYVVPAADPQVTLAGHVNEDAYFSYNYSTTPGDPEMPFVTTYQTGGDLNSIWIFVPVEGENNYYYIVHAKTGKYVKYQTYLTGDNARRKYVHLETMDAPGETEKFEITARDTGVKIKPKNNAMYFNIAGENQSRYNGGTTSPYYSGIIGGMNGTDNNSQFQLVDASSAADLTPVISDVDGLTNTFSIISPAAAFSTIHYTTDGTTTPDVNTSTTTNSGSPIFITGNWTVQAVGVFGNFVTPLAGPKNLGPAPCPTPVITVRNAVATITCPLAGAFIYYTTDGMPATTSSTPYEGPFAAAGVEVIRAIATSPGYLVSNEAFYYPFAEVSTSSEITNMNGRYILREGFTSSAPIGTAEAPFRGQIDGDYNAFTLNGHALVDVAEDAIIKNVVVSSVTYSGSGNVGAIVNTAKGGTKIYNCGVQAGSVSGGTNTGGLVGLIQAGSSVRVVNCYNFANVSGSDYAAGIVGKNEGTVASDGTVGNVRIALCMMYGSVSGATNISPVYCGNHVGNVQNYTEYNFYLYSNERDDDGNKIEKIPYTVYNDQQAITEEEYLTRFPFHRHILNTHRELGAFFLFGASTSSDVNSITLDEISEIGHWVLKPDEADYPIVEPWLTNKTNTTPTYEHNNLPNTTEDYKGRLLTEMGNNGYLNVSISIDEHSYSASLPITDMNTDRHDYTWGKVVLPFANEFEINTDYDRICTGWKITSVTKEGTAYSSYSATNYNFADRDNPQKDIYGGDNLFIFAQGGNYIVPYGVTAITIEANFANAIYLSDATYDVGFDANYANRAGLGGSVYANTEGKFHGKPVYHDIKDALASTAMKPKDTPHEQAIVLVGNYHFPSTDISSTQSQYNYLDSYKTKAFTLMSIDADNNQEPDYAFYSNCWLNRPRVPPVRFDFVALVPMGMAAHVHGSKYYPGLPIWNPRGWFEMTETSLCWANQFELASSQFNLDPATSTDAKKYNRLIINSGYFVQMVRASKTNALTGSNGNCQRLIYSQIGGNTYIKEYYPGSHSATPKTTTLVPVNVTGGEIEQCFMTGYGYKETGGVGNYGTVVGDNIYFWCAGGKIGKFLGAYMEGPVPATPGGKVNMTAKIDHALITEFYGGGTSPEAPITGKIDVTIKNSRVDRYCGGPEFGDMTSGETVTTWADKTTFGYFYGAGFGGTGITYYNYEDKTMDINTPNNTVTTTNFPTGFFASHYSPGVSDHGRLIVKNGGIGTCYKFEYIVNTSVVNKLVARFYVGFAKFDLATTGNVTNTLTDCTVLYDFFGGGCQGKVDGTVTSTLTNCTVYGNAFGAGYKATANDVEVYPTTDPKNPPYSLSKFTMATGIFSEFHIPDPVIFQWKQGTAGTSSDTNKELYTDKPMSTLGDVTGKVTITLKGKTTVMGSVFGGGYESKSLSNTEVQIYDRTKVFGNIYGGGNMGKVSGDTKVIINGTVPDETPTGNANNNNPNH